MVEPRVRRLLALPWAAAALPSGFSSESDVETWDLRASFTEYFCAVLRDCLDFPVPLPKRALLLELSSSAGGFLASLRGLLFTSLRRKTSRSDGRVKSVHQQKHTTVFYIDFVMSFSSSGSVRLSDQTVIDLLLLKGDGIVLITVILMKALNLLKVINNKKSSSTSAYILCLHTQRVTRNSLK